MKKAFIMIGIILLLALATVLIFTQTKKEPKELKIGAILPLTGSASPYGENARRGIEIALNEINSQGGILGKKIRVIFQDSKTDPKEAVASLQQLYNFEHIRYIIGDINSSGVLAMAPVAERNHILILSPGASSPDISNAGKWIFRNWHSDALEGKIDAQFAFSTLRWKKAAVLYVDAAYGVGLANTFREIFNGLGGTISIFEAYPQDAVDMRAQIIKILDDKPDGLYLPGWPKEMSIALKQLKELRSKLSILSAQGFDDPSIVKLAGNATEGVIFSVPEVPDPNNPIVRNFNEEYQKRYDQNPGVCSASGYDALRIYAYAIKKSGDNPEKVRDIMASLKNFPGANGPISFDENHDLLKPFMFEIVRDGKFIDYKGGV